MMTTALQRILFAGIVLSLASGFAGTAHAQTLLRYQYQNGESRNYELKQTLTTSSVVAGKEVSNHITQQLQLSTQVQGVNPDGSARVAKTISRCQLEVTQPGNPEPIHFDSASGTELSGPFGMIANSLNSLVQQQIAMTVCDRGVVSDVSIPPALEQRFTAPNPGIAGIDTREGLEKMLSQGSVVFPEQAVKVGEKWSRELSTELPFGTMKSVIDYEYAGRTADGLDRIDATTRISLTPKEGSPFQVTVKGADGQGVYLFDPQRGCVLASGLKQQMLLELSAVGQTLEQTVTTEISMKLLKSGQ
ncbi:MAG: hypothetical protein KDA78_02585 [Planctomycetaceae bacterium]|nr:hypothetical protein [Planctomycetaceae bacterium]